MVGTPNIKVITSVRRSRKSKLLEMFRNYIKENINYLNIEYQVFTKVTQTL